jgi:hypothetical protein
MRLAFFALLVTSTLVPPAPVPTDPKADARKLESLWADLLSTDPIVHARAVFALIDHPKATDFLTAKLPPVKASADQLKTWLTDLNSDDENVRTAAFEELKYFDPRTELTASEQVGMMTTDHGRLLLASVWRGDLLELRPDTIRTDLKPQVGNRWYLFEEYRTDGGPSGTGIDPTPAAEITSPTWRRAAVAAIILERKGTGVSLAALKRLSTGRPDALPTPTAAELLKAKLSAGMTVNQFTALWDDVLPSPAYDPDPVAITRGLLALANAPESAKLLKAKLHAIKAGKEQVTKWVKSLDSDDVKEWKPAYEQLLVHRPLLTHTWREQCDAVTTDGGRSRLYWLAGSETEPPGAEYIFADSTLKPRGDDGLALSYSVGNGRLETWQTPGTLAILAPPHWQRARLVVLALERMKSAEAKAVLTQLAAGHPDILPTREAKSALERAGK